MVFFLTFLLKVYKELLFDFFKTYSYLLKPIFTCQCRPFLTCFGHVKLDIRVARDATKRLTANPQQIPHIVLMSLRWQLAARSQRE